MHVPYGPYVSVRSHSMVPVVFMFIYSKKCFEVVTRMYGNTQSRGNVRTATITTATVTAATSTAV